MRLYSTPSILVIGSFCGVPGKKVEFLRNKVPRWKIAEPSCQSDSRASLAYLS
jgi:hypothetical protein